MLFKRVESKGLAHYSYIIGDGSQALVIDPRRDCQVYVDEALAHDMRIAHILETHRNEDYIVGSVELANRTGAQIWHADSQLNYQYGQPVEKGQLWKIGRLRVEALHTPGHTKGSMSYVLYDPDEVPWIIFTGDALFAGGVGRVDFYGRENTATMAGKLYDSIYKKILPLGDEVIVCPAHGSGSVCATNIAERIWTTVGLEKKHNPMLQFKDKSSFIDTVAEKLEYPPYFAVMEENNSKGAPIIERLPNPVPLSPDEFKSAARDAVVLDTRMETDYGAAHIPNSISIWKEGLPSFAGWFLPQDKPILLVTDPGDLQQVVRYLIRLGYDNLVGTLSGGLLSWHMGAHESDTIQTTTVGNLCTRLDEGLDTWILDVRSDDEVKEQGQISNATHIHLTQIEDDIDKVPDDKLITVFCGSGLRSMIAASILRRKGWSDLLVVLGGLAGWNSSSCPVM